MDSIKPIKPIKLSTTTYKTETNEKLTSAEIGKLWITYMGNSMSKCVLSYFLQHMEDDEIKNIYEKALNLTDEFIQKIRKIYIQEHHPIPIGFTEEDVNLDAPRLFMDEFYLHYLKYVAKAGMSIYSIAISLMVRPDTRTFFTNALNSTINLMNEINELLMKKGFVGEVSLHSHPPRDRFC
jgi:spore coat protein CotF